MRARYVAKLLALIVLLACDPARAAEPPAAKLAILGYDPVAYFTERQPVRGNADISYSWDGERYQFASTANHQRFVAEPDRYAPNYSAHCASAMTRGVLVAADPRFWLIIDGKLYLFAGPAGRDQFAKNPALVKDAEAGWAAVPKPTK